MPTDREHALAIYRRAQLLLTRFLQRYWYRAAQGAGGLGDLFVTVEEVSAELEIGELQPPLALDPPEEIAAELAKHRGHERASRLSNPHWPACELARAASLTDESLEYLLVLATLQGSPGLLRTCTFAWADFSIKQPTAGFIVELLADDAEHRLRLEGHLAPDAPLRRLRLLQLGEDRRWQPATPLLQRPVFVPDAVGRFLSGLSVLDEGYPPAAVRLETLGPWPETLILHARERADRFLAANVKREDALPVVLVGGIGSGRRTLARAHALAAGRPLFVVDLAALAWELEPFEQQVAALIRDGMLAGAATFLRADGFDDRTDKRPAILGRTIRALGLPVIVSTTEHALPIVTSAMPDVHIIHLGDVPLDARPGLYRHLFSQRGFPADLEVVSRIADTYRLRPGDLDRALRDVRATTGEQGDFDLAAFDGAVRRQVRSSLSALASPVTTTQRWTDLVLPEEQRLVIEEIILHAKFRVRVFEDWGFSRKLGARGRGLGCLFSGPPGTGKTMTATLIAQELGLDLYQVDLSRIVDKYVGETEKNLARLFDEASRVPVVLLFDEADSLFASRTKVESSNDRYANLEVNFLLQRMEVHDGISILTTNMGTGIDQAFKRRLRFRVHFDLPEAEEREVLWRSMVPSGLAITNDIDWMALAKRWEISGAIIRNAMLRAAFLSAAYGRPLDNELLQRATKSELWELGRLGS